MSKRIFVKSKYNPSQKGEVVGCVISKHGTERFIIAKEDGTFCSYDIYDCIRIKSLKNAT